MMAKALIAGACMLAASVAQAEWAEGRGELTFAAHTPEADACHLAEEKAKQAALIKILGEQVAIDDIEVCREQADDTSCTLGRLVWAASSGEVRALRNMRAETSPTGLSGFRVCRVSLEADVARWQGAPNPAFDMAVRVNQSAFRNGEDMTIEVIPTQPMHLAVFQWLPYEQRERQVQRLFPNAMDSNDHISGRTTVPSADGSARYSIRMAFPHGSLGRTPSVTEYLLVVGTRSRVGFRDSYSLEDFKARLLEIPRADFRLVRKGYAIMRPQ